MIIALDPGITTGVAMLHQTKNIRIEQLKYTHAVFYRWLDAQMPTTIIYERFIYQRRNKVELYPVEVIGVIKLFAEERDIPLYEQSASQAKGFITDEKIKSLALWEKGQVHGMDALRHLLYHEIVTKGDMTWLNLLRPD